MTDKLVSPVRTGTIDTGSEAPEKFPFDAFSFDPPGASTHRLRLKNPWQFSSLFGVKIISSANYTILDDDGWTEILVSTGASDRTITLPLAANNAGRAIDVIKTDSGAGQVIIDGNGSETINGVVSVYLGFQYSKVRLVCEGTAWFLLGPFNPVAGEPSLGTPHPKYVLLVNGAPVVGTVTVDLSIGDVVPAGMGRVYVQGNIQSGAGGTSVLFVTDMAGNAYVTAVAQGANDNAGFSGYVPLDSSRRFKYTIAGANSAAVNMYMGFYDG